MAKRKIKRRQLLRAIRAASALLVVLIGMAVLMEYIREDAPEATAPSTTPTAATVPVSPYTPGDFGDAEGFLTCLSGDSRVGIDVSRYQGQIDWDQVRDAGVEFVMVRLGFRGIGDGSLNTDPYAKENLEGARAAGLLVGAYFYSQATSVEEAEEEARFALEILGDFRLDLPLAYDWEIESRTENVDIATATACAAAFCDTVEAAGNQPMIYFNRYQAEERLDLRALTDYPWWLAMYNIGEDFPCAFSIWQYTDCGTVPGITGTVDVNVMVLGGMP